MVGTHVHGLDATALAGLAAGHGDAPARLLAHDHLLWRDDPAEVADRLGWLDVAERHEGDIDRLEALAAGCRADGVRDVVVVGMGGSSLFPEVLAQTLGSAAGFPTLDVLDSTHPAAVARVLNLAADRTLIVVASKSGTTIEPRSHLEALWAARSSADAGRGFMAITDPGSDLDLLAVERGFRAVLRNPADVGGRFSALTLFGLAPAALLGRDGRVLLDAARQELVDISRRGWDSAAGQLALAIAGGVAAGRDKLVLDLPAEAAALGSWIEQLVAESLGKDGMTVVPVVGDRLDDLPDAADRLVVTGSARRSALPHVVLDWSGTDDLGAHVMRWEVATALVGALLGVQPFDQPDVATAKAATSRVLDAGLADVATSPLADALADVRTGDHVALTGFVDPGGGLPARLEHCRQVLRDRLGATVTLGIGPRFLHSTGQLHKGGGRAQVILQVVEHPGDDVAIPGQSFGFATLFLAQAQGDLDAMRASGRRAHRLELAEVLAFGEA